MPALKGWWQLMRRYILLTLLGSTLYAQQMVPGTADSPAPSAQPAIHSAATPVPVVQATSPKPAKSSTSIVRQVLPHPYVYGGLGLMGGGYAPLAALGGVGVRIDATHLIFDASAAYDNGHKTNDGDQPNSKGHDRSLAGSAYYRLSSGWFFGAGYGWSQLSTTNYTKGGSRPRFGGGKDFFAHEDCPLAECAVTFSARLQVDWLMAGTDWQNGSHGPLISFYIPSPAAKGHLFWRQSVGIYRFHDSVTAPSDPVLTKEQMSQHSADSFAEMTLMYRF